jgi:hypothetical protein
MIRGAPSSSTSYPGRFAEASGSGTKQEDARPAPAASRQGEKASGPALQRSKSVPARLASNPRERAEVKAERKPITRPEPDIRVPPEVFDFRVHAGGRRLGAEFKKVFLEAIVESYPIGDSLVREIQGSRHCMQLIHSVHPKFRYYSPEQKIKAYEKLAFTHPGLLAKLAKMRNESHAIPNYPTSSRLMEADEQKFLTKAMQRIHEDVEKKPFHMHGESGAVGNQDGEIVFFGHNPCGSVGFPVNEGEKYALHNHPPFTEPFTSSASERDHRGAAETYSRFNNEMKEYLTNGKEVLHISPNSMELIKLHPDPSLEETLGKFPVAFALPKPQDPPYPFANHEAPAAFGKDWAPPAGWSPPADYPRSRAAG